MQAQRIARDPSRPINAPSKTCRSTRTSSQQPRGTQTATTPSLPRRGIAGIVGPYRFRNFGDDLIGLLLARHLSRSGFDQVWMHDIAAHNASIAGATVRPRKDVIWRPDLVVIGGGHILGDGSYFPSAYYQRLAFLTALARWVSRKRTEICGVGAGPLAFWSARLYGRLTCQLVDRVGVRDPESSRFVTGPLNCAEWKVIEGADLALLWPELLPTRVHPQSERSAIGVQMDWARAMRPPADELPRGALDSLGGRLLYLSNRGKSTRARSLIQVDGSEANYTLMPEFLQDFTRCRVVITTHLHLAIAAYAARIPSFTLAVNPKTRRFYNQIGHPDRCIDLSTAGTLSNHEFAGLLRHAAHDCEWSAQDDVRLAELQRRARGLLDGVGG